MSTTIDQAVLQHMVIKVVKCVVCLPKKAVAQYCATAKVERPGDKGEGGGVARSSKASIKREWDDLG